LPLLLKNADGCATDVLKRPRMRRDAVAQVAVVGGFDAQKKIRGLVLVRLFCGRSSSLFHIKFFDEKTKIFLRRDKTPFLRAKRVLLLLLLLLFQVLSSSRMVDDDDDDEKEDEMAMERAPPTVPQTRPPFPPPPRPPPSLETQHHHIEKLSDYVAKNGVEFEEMMRQKRMEMFWWLEDKSSREYGVYKRLLESKIGIPKANARVPGTPTTTTTATMSHEHQHQRQQTNNDANHVQAQIEAAKMKAQKMLTEEKEKAKKVIEYVEDTSLFDNIVGNVPQNARRANAGFQNGTYNAIDVLTAPKNVNEELIQRKSKVVEKYFEKRMELFEYELERATNNKCINNTKETLYRNANENEDEINELREMRRQRRRRGGINETVEEAEEKFNASRGSKRGLGMAEQEERNGDIEFMKYRNQLSRRYHGI